MPEESNFEVSTVGMLQPAKPYGQAHSKFHSHDVQMVSLLTCHSKLLKGKRFYLLLTQ